MVDPSPEYESFTFPTLPRMGTVNRKVKFAQIVGVLVLLKKREEGKRIVKIINERYTVGRKSQRRAIGGKAENKNEERERMTNHTSPHDRE